MGSSRARIRILAELVINQIAAGEVIERPASVVKELLENSMDAGARRVDIEVEDSGVGLIRVRDDGCGILGADLGVALARHATNKIQTLDDLERVSTLGFRGEALSSIGAISRVMMSSRVSGEDCGWRIRVDGQGPVSDVEPAAHPLGTTVEVRELFYNTPVRRKFLRSRRTEFHLLQQVVRQFVLGRFDIGFRLAHNRRRLLQLGPAMDHAARARRIGNVCGAQFLRHSVVLNEAADGVRISGWLGLPEAVRRQPDTQYFYLNGRVVRDKRVNHAVRRAYQELLDPDRHPAYLLFLEMDPSRVDVNVHPTKCEVRFRDARMVHDFIYAALHRPLRNPSAAPAPETLGAIAGLAKQSRGNETEFSLPAPSLKRAPPSHPQDGQVLAPAASRPLGTALGVVAGVFLLAKNELGLLLVDISAAVEHICYSRLKTAYQTDNIKLQPLLIPIAVQLRESEVELMRCHLETLHKAGFDARCIGPRSVLVHQLPVELSGSDVKELIREVIGVLPNQRDDDVAHCSERLFRLMAKHGRLEYSQPGTSEQMSALLRDLERVPEKLQDRPVWRQLTQQDLARLIRA